MAGRRLSSNDVSVVIALAIVVLVLLLIFIAERGAAPDDERGGAGAGGARADGEAAAAPSFIGLPSDESRVAAGSGACGIGSLQREPGQSDEDVAARQRDEAVQAILAALDARPEPRARAAALYFRAARDRIDTRTCKQHPESCSPADHRQGEDRDSAAALARLAVESADPQVYAWAYRSCAVSSRDVASSCQLVNALQWARLDPSNAEPWFAVASEARSRRDFAALDDAMFHVAAASAHDSGWGRVAAEMIEAAPKSDRLVIGTALASQDAIRYETLDLAMPETWRYCEARAIANANRRDTCEKIATMLVERSTTLIGRAVGAQVGKKLDWAPERLMAWELGRDAAYAVELRDASPPGPPLDCGNVRRDLSRWLDIARGGEVEALKRRVAATGESIAKLAAEGKEAARLEHEATLAQAVASSASGAASAAAATGSESRLPPPAR